MWIPTHHAATRRIAPQRNASLLLGLALLASCAGGDEPTLNPAGVWSATVTNGAQVSTYTVCLTARNNTLVGTARVSDARASADFSIAGAYEGHEFSLQATYSNAHVSWRWVGLLIDENRARGSLTLAGDVERGTMEFVRVSGAPAWNCPLTQ